MENPGKFFKRRPTDALGGRVGRNELGITLLELLEFSKQPVVLGVGNGRCI
jgi:hypothetical protein